jgi:hypothetical protein
MKCTVQPAAREIPTLLEIIPIMSISGMTFIACFIIAEGTKVAISAATTASRAVSTIRFSGVTVRSVPGRPSGARAVFVKFAPTGPTLPPLAPS